MKKVLLLTSFFILLCFIILNYFNQPKLDSAVERVLKVSNPTELEMQNNAFVGLLAIDAPENTNPQKLGEDLVLAYTKLYEKALKKQDSSLDIKDSIRWSNYVDAKKMLSLSFNYPCAGLYLGDKDCITKIKQNKKEYVKIISEDYIMLNRYKKNITQPNYNSYNDYLTIIPLDNMRKLSNLHLIEAVYAIDEGDVDKGIDILQSELNFYKRNINNTQRFDRIQLIMFTTRLRSIYYLISTLLDEKNMQDYLNSPKLEQLLRSFTESEQKILLPVLVTVRNQNLQLMYFDVNSYATDERLAFFSDDIKNLNDLTWYKKFFWRFDQIRTMNLYYNAMKPYIASANLVLPESSDYYRKKIKPLLNQKPMSIVEIESEYPNNTLGNLYIKGLERQAINNYLRLYDIISYLKLVQVKLDIKKFSVPKDNIPNFLNSLGEKALNPYSKQPIKWDNEAQTIYYNWLNTEGYKNNDKARIHL